jgi:AcrR family transcriptional regulator
MITWTKRQKEIIDATMEIISKQGIQHLTIKTLATKIKVTDGAIYRHFKNKEEIFTFIAELFKSSTDDILNQILAAPTSGIEKIKTFFIERCRQFSQNPGLVIVMFSEDIFKGHKSLQKKIHETIQSHKQLIEEAITQSQQEGIIKDIEPEHLFMVIMGALRLLVTRWRGVNFKFNLLAEGEKLWQSLEKLISAKH